MTDINGRLAFNVNSLTSNPSTASSVLAQLQAAGVYIVRIDFSWNIIEPSDGTFDWTATDTAMLAAQANGVQVMGIVDYCALWANDGSSIFTPPSNSTQYAAFAAAIATRYGQNGTLWSTAPGSLTFRPLISLEIWNEPNGNWFWLPGASPTAYATLAAAAIIAIRTVDPSIKLLVCGDWWCLNADYSNGYWLAPLLAAPENIASLVDAFAVHPYPDPKNLGPDDITGSTTNRYFSTSISISQGILEDAGINKPIWVTEIGWTTGGDEATTAVSQAQQSTNLSRAVTRTLDEFDCPIVAVYSFDLAEGAAAEFNGTFESATDLAAWTGLGATIALDTSKSHSGSSSLKVTATGGTPAAAYRNGGDNVDVGKSYTLSAWVYGPPGGQFFSVVARVLRPWRLLCQ
ncbi:MAG: cellulase family glycosylhydrolase [Candidatus Saccharibacteria bacterium]